MAGLVDKPNRVVEYQKYFQVVTKISLFLYLVPLNNNLSFIKDEF